MLHGSAVTKSVSESSRTPKNELKALEQTLARAMGRCISDFGLLEPNDRVMVCMSGGKDSYALMTLLERFRRKSPFPIELIAVHLDQAQPGYDGAPLREWLAGESLPHQILREDTYSTVIKHIPEGKTYCSLCSRLRRGILYRAATELGCTKIALGHHRDDAVETLLLNLTYTGALASMPPKLKSRDGKHTVIRPLLFCKEAVIARYAELMRYPILPCNLCGSQEQLKRKRMKQLLKDLESFAPNARDSMLAAMGNVKARHLLDATLQHGAPDLAAAALEGDDGDAFGTDAPEAVALERDEPALEPSEPATSPRRLPLLL
jgi:tRNA 2-thiocytidine biosynthesis protein TtcA